MMYQLSTLYLLLTAAAAAEMYDAVPDAENEVLFQDSHVIDSGPVLDPRSDEWLQDLLLFKSSNRRLRKERAELGDMENSVVKRDAPELGPRPQRWWKTKNRRGVGAQMCYFKLCTFRKPV